MLVDTESRRLAIGEQADANQAGVPHPLDDLICRARRRVAPVAGEFDRGGKEG
ncbi:hypothetical protein X727_31865 [Mesorhizobium sp. L103C119B0]|nr:hypothetical protein X727_31865 [Mesorhizobium sp. L103C119B0]